MVREDRGRYGAVSPWRSAMTGKGDEPSTIAGLQYPMVDLFTGGMMLFVNAAATYYLLSLTAPLALMEAWTKALENQRSP